MACFEEFATTVFREFGSRVSNWITHNEPWCAAMLGYGIGVHAPGHTDWREALTAAHHILLSHGKAIQIYRKEGYAGNIGITLNLTPVDAASEDPADLAAQARQDGFANRWFLDPIFKGEYPSDMMSLYGEAIGNFNFIESGDLEVISMAQDFLGINFYSRSIVKHSIQSDSLLQLEHVQGEGKRTDMDWEIHPESLYKLLKRLKSEYTDLPLYITENGAAFPDQVVNGEILDTERIEYFRGHFEAAHQFMEEGGNLKGYYAWSFLDNYEWAYGYSKRFGIVYVDYETQQRIPKNSAKWYKEVIQTNSLAF